MKLKLVFGAGPGAESVAGGLGAGPRDRAEPTNH
jgi:hypothetical protein